MVILFEEKLNCLPDPDPDPDPADDPDPEDVEQPALGHVLQLFV